MISDEVECNRTPLHVLRHVHKKIYFFRGGEMEDEVCNQSGQKNVPIPRKWGVCEIFSKFFAGPSILFGFPFRCYFLLCVKGYDAACWALWHFLPFDFSEKAKIQSRYQSLDTLKKEISKSQCNCLPLSCNVF